MTIIVVFISFYHALFFTDNHNILLLLLLLLKLIMHMYTHALNLILSSPTLPLFFVSKIKTLQLLHWLIFGTYIIPAHICTCILLEMINHWSICINHWSICVCLLCLWVFLLVGVCVCAYHWGFRSSDVDLLAERSEDLLASTSSSSVYPV